MLRHSFLAFSISNHHEETTSSTISQYFHHIVMIFILSFSILPSFPSHHLQCDHPNVRICHFSFHFQIPSWAQQRLKFALHFAFPSQSMMEPIIHTIFLVPSFSSSLAVLFHHSQSPLNAQIGFLNIHHHP